MTRFCRLLSLFLVLVLSLSGCSEPVETPPTTTIPETTAAPAKTFAPSPTDYLSDSQIALADPWGGSNESALASVMKKAAAGEDVTIAVIGGSITQGTISHGAKDAKVKQKQMYAEIFRDWWITTFPESKITFVNAGIGATDSYLAVHRVQKDVLDHDPDLILIEFSVNDSSSTSHKTSYDNLIRKILLSEDAPAVLLLFLSQTNGSTAQDIHSLIGFNYSLPMVTYLTVMNDLMESGTYSAKDLSGDTVHPSALGHRIIGEILWKYLNSIWKIADQLPEPEVFNKSAFTKDKYIINPQILDSKSLSPTDLGNFENSSVFQHFPNSWTTQNGGEITFELSFRNLGIIYYCQVDGNGGQFEVLIDGEKVQTLNADFSGGWGNYAATTECYASDSSSSHTVTIRMAEDSKGSCFTVLGFLVSE